MTRRARWWIVVLVGLTAFPFGSLAAATQDSGVDAARQEAAATLVEGLEQLAVWCNRKKLFLERNNVYAEILVFDPDNATARKGLGFKKNKQSGEWEQAKEPRPPKNMGKGALEELPAERAAAVKPYVDQMLALLETANGSLAPEVRESILNDIFHIDPQNATAHRMAGNVEVDGVWMLEDTARSKKRRATLRGFLGDTYKNTPRPGKGTMSSRDSDIGLGWTQCVALPAVRVVSTGDEDEALLAARAVQVAQDYFNGVFETNVTLPKDFTLYLLADAKNEKTPFLDGHPEAAAMDRAQLEPLDGAGFSKSNDFAHWSADAPRRIDAAVHFSIGWLTQRAFRINTDKGWIYEGLGLYMTREIVGTRLNWFVQPSESLDALADAELLAKLLNPETNWMSTALEILTSAKRPLLHDVVQKSANQMTAADMLLGYVTVAYLIEAVPPEWTIDFLRAIGRNQAIYQSSQQFLRLSIDELDARVLRWLKERR